MTLEKRLEKKLPEDIKDRGGIALKFWCVSFTGMPDRMILLPGGKVIFAELKSESKTPSPRQRYVHRQLRRLGFEVWTVASEEQYCELLNRIDHGV